MKKTTKTSPSGAGSRSDAGPFAAFGELKRAVKRVAKRVSERAAERERVEPISSIRLLKKQHREVKALFEQIASARLHTTKRALLEELAANLVAHDAIEREIFYPACEQKLGLTKTLGEAIVEHGLVEFSLYQADRARAHEEFDAKVIVLREVVLHHVKEEESEFLPQVERAFSDDELVELGGKMRTRFEEAKAGDYRAALEHNLRQVLRGVLKPEKAKKPAPSAEAPSSRARSARPKASKRSRAA